MNVTQIRDLVNAATTATLGESAVLEEDLSNVVDLGKAVFSADKVDNYVKKLVNQIGKVVFTERTYSGSVPSVLMDKWEFGSVLEKVTPALPEATESDSWQLTDGTDYSPNTFHQPDVSAKFFNSKVTFEIPLSFTEMQVKESFTSANQLNGFLSMLTTSVQNSMTVKQDALIMRTLNHMIAETFIADLGTIDAGPPIELTIDTTDTTVKAVNLLKLYNAEFGTTLTAAKCLTDPAFIRYATYTISLYQDRMSRLSSLFNVGGKEKFTPKDSQHIVLLSDFAKSAETFLLSSTYHADRIALPSHETVPYWQGSGTGYAFSDVTSINTVTGSSEGEAVNVTGIIGIAFDRMAADVSNLDRRVTTNYNPKAEFYTNFYKFDAGYYNDLDENFVVFFVG